MRMIKSILISIVVIVIAIVAFIECNRVKFNNVDDKELLITKTYSSTEFDELQYKISCGKVYLKDLKRDFKIECLRKIPRGSYAVFKQDDEQTVFVFIDKDAQILGIQKMHDFKHKEEFEKNVTEGMTRIEVLEYDGDVVATSLPSYFLTTHSVQEGTFFVHYRRNILEGEKGKRIVEYVVDSLEFFDNAENCNPSQGSLISYVPYILEIDRK